MIVYKVVGSRNRMSVNVVASMVALEINLHDFRKSYMVGDLKKYFLKYNKGEIVKAEAETAGIFCLKNKFYAECFVERLKFNFGGNYQIIKVKGIGKKFLPAIFSYYLVGDPNTIVTKIEKNKSHIEFLIPPGTICFKSVEVLE